VIWNLQIATNDTDAFQGGNLTMLIRQPIRNNRIIGEKKPRVFDAIIDTQDGEVYLELKNAKQKEVVRLCDVLAQIEQAKRQAHNK